MIDALVTSFLLLVFVAGPLALLYFAADGVCYLWKGQTLAAFILRRYKNNTARVHQLIHAGENETSPSPGRKT